MCGIDARQNREVCARWQGETARYCTDLAPSRINTKRGNPESNPGLFFLNFGYLSLYFRVNLFATGASDWHCWNVLFLWFLASVILIFLSLIQHRPHIYLCRRMLEENMKLFQYCNDSHASRRNLMQFSFEYFQNKKHCKGNGYWPQKGLNTSFWVPRNLSHHMIRQ